MDARLSAAIDSFEASMRAVIRDAIREAMDSALTAIHKAVNPVLAKLRSDLAQSRRDLALGVEGDSDPASMCSKEAKLMEECPQKLQKLETHDEDGNPLRISSTIHNHSIPPLLSSSPLLRALATSAVKPHSKDSAAVIVSLPESKTGIHASTMTSAPRLLHEHSFSNTTKTGPEVVLNLSIISANSEAKFPSLLNDNYSAYLKDKFGWVSWYLVGKFVRKDFCAWKLFDEILDSSCYAILNRDMCYYNGIRDKGGGSKFRKMQLKMAVAQIKLLRNKKQAVVKQMRRDIALLLQSSQDATAQIWVEHVFKEQKILAANEFIELFCELVVSRLFIITKQRECPLNLKEGIASLIFASSRCYEISELISKSVVPGIRSALFFKQWKVKESGQMFSPTAL